MATVSNTPRPGYVWDSTDNVWYPIGVGGHGHSDYITQATAVNPTIIDAKGDIITATAADTPARLAVGNNGETLVADSSTSTGLRYTAGTVQSNPVLNSAFQVWQRGTSISLAASSNSYTADRWLTPTNANQACTVSRQATGDTTNLPNIQYAMRFQRNSGQTGVGATYQMQSFESVNSIPYAGKTVTISFYARKGANYSQASSALPFYLDSGTGTDQNVGTGFTGQVTVASTSPTLTTTWQRFTATGTVGTTATQLAVYTVFTPTGTAGAADYFEITGVQIDIGSVALPFRTYAATIQGELAACQRYYFRSGASNGATTSAYNLHAQGYEESATSASICFKLPVTMRVAPTAIEYANVDIYDSTARSLSALTINGSYNNTNSPELVATGTGMAQYRPCFLLNWNNTGGYVALTAEL